MNVKQCEKVKVFNWEDPKIGKDAEDGVENQYPLFLFEKVVPRLERLVLNQNHVKMIRNDQFQDDIFNRVEFLTLDSFHVDESLVFLYTFLERFPRLKYLEVTHSSFEDIYPTQGPPSDPPRKVPIFTSLSHTHLDQLQSIWNKDSQIHPVLQILEESYVDHCSKLISLAPSSTSFDYLNLLNMSGCHCMSYLLTTSTCKSLVHLKQLEISDCKMMEEIVINEGEDVEDPIVSKNLDDMKLIDLPILKSFYSQTCTFEFPSLMDVNIRGCSKMKMFRPGVLVTPLLEDVKVEETVECWDENLNKTLE